MRRGIKDARVKVAARPDRVIRALESLHNNNGLDLMLQAPDLPIEPNPCETSRSAILTFQSVGGVRARDEARESALTHATFLRNDRDDEGYASNIAEERKAQSGFRYGAISSSPSCGSLPTRNCALT